MPDFRFLFAFTICISVIIVQWEYDTYAEVISGMWYVECNVM